MAAEDNRSYAERERERWERDEQLANAIIAADIQAVGRLLDQGANPKTRWGHQNGFALHWATSKRDPELVCRLLVEHGADVNATDLAGQSALHVAAVYGRAKAVRVLLMLGADPNILDYENKTALDWAFGLGKDEVVSMLSPVTEHEEIHPAVIAGETDRVRRLLDQDPAWISRKTNIVGDTLLHDAVRLGHRAIVELLLSRGADPNARSHTTPLKLSYARNFKDIASLLKQHGGIR
jgi:uncharacterized protein